MLKDVWKRIIENEAKYSYKKGKIFKWIMKGNNIKPIATKRLIPKSDIKKDLDYVAFENTAILNEIKVQGPSFIFTILMDERIRNNNW